jgi:hypothetical protein
MRFIKRMRPPLRWQFGLLSVSGLLMLIIASCQGEQPIQYLMEVTREVTVVVVITATPSSPQPETPEVTVPIPVTPEPVLPTPTAEATTEQTSTDPFPAPIVSEIIVAEQVFERGRMFYLQPSGEIWVLENGSSGEDEFSGSWTPQDDTWQEGMPEFDPAITAPEGLFQPERGFGKLWRENPSIQEALGWALEAEYGHVTEYSYTYGGQVNSQATYVQGPGTHTIRSREGDTFVFYEADATWERIEAEAPEQTPAG